MSITRSLIMFIISIMGFIISCLLILFAHEEVSKSTLGTYVLLAVALISLITWPIFLVRLVSQWVEDKIR
jgi:uncharacterized membrane protein